MARDSRLEAFPRWIIFGCIAIAVILTNLATILTLPTFSYEFLTMASIVSKPTQEWRSEKDGVKYLVSTSRDHISLSFVNDALSTDEMPWAKTLPLEDLEMLLANSLTLGVYIVSPKIAPPSTVSSPSSPRTPSPTLDMAEDLEQIGMARFITDFVTLAYLTDVYILPEYRHRGLSTWLIECSDEVIKTMPHLRRAMLMSSLTKEKFYNNKLGMHRMQDEEDMLCMSTRNF